MYKLYTKIRVSRLYIIFVPYSFVSIICIYIKKICVPMNKKLTDFLIFPFLCLYHFFYHENVLGHVFHSYLIPPLRTKRC